MGKPPAPAVAAATTGPLPAPAAPRRPCTIPLEKRRLGGNVRVGKVASPHDVDPTAAQAARRAAFCGDQRRRGVRGAAVTRARYGPQVQAAILAAYYRDHPTSLERFVAAVLDADGVCYKREEVVEVVQDVTYWRLDFLLPGCGPDGADLVIEPGARHWHTPERDAARNRVLGALGYRYVLTLTDLEIEQLPDAARRCIRDFVARPRRTDLSGQEGSDGVCTALHAPAA